MRACIWWTGYESVWRQVRDAASVRLVDRLSLCFALGLAPPLARKTHSAYAFMHVWNAKAAGGPMRWGVPSAGHARKLGSAELQPTPTGRANAPSQSKMKHSTFFSSSSFCSLVATARSAGWSVI